VNLNRQSKESNVLDEYERMELESALTENVEYNEEEKMKSSNNSHHLPSVGGKFNWAPNVVDESGGSIRPKEASDLHS